MKRFLLVCISALTLMSLFAGCRDTGADISPSPVVTTSPSPLISPNVSPDVTDGVVGDIEDAVEKGADDVKDGVDKMMEPSKG